MKSRFFYPLLACLWTATLSATELPPSADGKTIAGAASAAADSKQIEIDLQRLPWPQFRFVIESVPKLRADVEAYGAIGWKFVQSNYTSHAWKKNIDKLDDEQKQHLVDLIRAARSIK